MVYIKSRNLEIEVTDDNPFENDKLDREPLCKILTNVASFYGQSGCVMALNGEWGAGKTTFVKLWRAYLKNKGFNTLYFNAWESDYTDDPLMALVAELNELSLGRDYIDQVVTGAARIGLCLAKGVFKRLTGADSEEIGAVLDEATDIGKKYIEEYSEQKSTLKDFKENLTNFVAGNVVDIEHPVVFFIDELDRCNPHYAVSVLERVKHLFEIPNIIFVLAINKKELSNAICGFYGTSKVDSDEYLRRFIDIEYTLPIPKLETYCNYLYEQYGFADFFLDEERRRRSGYASDEGFFKKMAYQMCAASKTNLRQIDRIYAYSRLAIQQFPISTKFKVDLYFLLCFWRVLDYDFYSNIKEKRYTVQELLLQVEDRLPLDLLEADYLSTGVDISDVTAALLYSYDITSISSIYPQKPSVEASADEISGEPIFPLVPRIIDKEALNNSLAYYYHDKSEKTQYGLAHILQRIDLLQSFKV